MVVSATLRQLSFFFGRDFLRLQLMCLIFAGFKRVAPEHASGIEIEERFLTALETFNEKRPAS